MFSIDVHMLVYDEPEWMIDRCMQSLRNQPVNIHVVQGFDEFPPLQGRAKGLEQGSAPFVSWVDPDDWCEPDIYEKLLDKLHSSNADIVFCWEYVYTDKGAYESRRPHHGILTHRSNVPYIDDEYYSVYRFDRVAWVEEFLYHHDRRAATRRRSQK